MNEFDIWCANYGVYRDSNGRWQVANSDDLEPCPQCGEEAWDGYICHSCGAKNI